MHSARLALSGFDALTRASSPTPEAVMHPNPAHPNPAQPKLTQPKLAQPSRRRRPPPRRMRLAAAAVAALTVTGGAVADGANASVPRHVDAGPDIPTVVSATPDSALNAQFTAYGNSGDGWTGADSTWSTRLPGGKELFMFSDTFLEPITAPTRPTDAQLVHNSFVQIDQGHMSTIIGGTPTQPDTLIQPSDPSHWFWLGAGTYLGGTLQVPLTEWRSTGSGAFDLALVGSSLARFAPTDLRHPLSITALPRAAGYEWGQWVLPQGDYTYVYGIEDLGADKYLHIARVHGTDLRAAVAVLPRRGPVRPRLVVGERGRLGAGDGLRRAGAEHPSTAAEPVHAHDAGRHGALQ